MSTGTPFCCFSCIADAKEIEEPTAENVPMTTIVPKAQIVRFDEEATISDEFIMCTAPPQPKGFDKKGQHQTQVLQVDIDAPCSIFMMRDNGNLIVVRRDSMTGVRVLRALPVGASAPDTLEEASAVVSGAKPRKTSIAGRKTSVKGLLNIDPSELEGIITNESAAAPATIEITENARGDSQKSHPGKLKTSV
jgi:hypothetical protein